MPAVVRSTHPVTIIATLPPQIRTSRISLKKFNPVRNAFSGWRSVSFKPHGTGLWTSTWTPKCSYASDWMRFCLTEDFSTASWRYGYVYTVRKGLRIVEIDTLADLQAVLDEFGQVDPIMAQAGFERRYPDWERMAKHFHAVHLTENGQWRTRFSQPNNLYDWDCESTLWLRMSRNTLKFARKIHFGIGGQRQTREQQRERNQIRRNRMREALEGLKEEERKREHD